MSIISELSSETTCSDISVCDEIGMLIEKCEEIYHHVHNSFEILQNIHSLADNHKNINVSFNNQTVDFDQILEQLHSDTLNKIKDGIPCDFGEELIKVICQVNFL